MDDELTRTRRHPSREIKEEPEEEEIPEQPPTQTTNPAEHEEEESTSNNVQRKRGRTLRPRRVKQDEEEVEVTSLRKRIKSEPEEEEEWSEDDDDDEDEDYDDPDYNGSDDDGCNADDAGVELVKQRNAEASSSTDGGGGLCWEFRATPDTEPVPFRFRPVRDAGSTLDRTASWTPLSVFQLFCSNSVIRTIVTNTNKNMERQKQDKKKLSPVTFKEFYMFLTAVMYTSLVKVPDLKDYWRKTWLYDLPFPRNFLSRDRFKKLSTTLILYDPKGDEENELKKDTPEYDKLFKIEPFYSEIINAFKANFQPHRNICVHERMVKKNKPLKCGYRLFALADSLTGYTWNLYMHTGKTRGQTAGYTAVKNLLPLTTLGSGYTLYTDFPFTSPSLFTELLDNNIGCCGILSKHHSEFPKNAQRDFPTPSASRGDIRWLRKDKLLFVKWMDTREVAMCSTVHEAFTGQVMKRPVKQGKGWVQVQFSCPDAVADFNRHMIVAKKSDFDFSYNMPCTRIEWHRIFFYHLLDLAVVNSSIVYNEILKGKGENPIPQKDFREELCKEMIKFAYGSEPECVSSKHNTNNTNASANTSTSVNTSANATATANPSVLCMPLYFVPGNATEGRKKCRWCSKQTPIYCHKCLIPLCLTCSRNCYQEWHEAQWIKKKHPK